MIKRFWQGIGDRCARLTPSRKLLNWGLLCCLFIGLSGCGGRGTAPPQAVITQAVVAQAQNNQTTLWQQLALQSDATPTLSVKNVKARKTRPVKVADDLAYEVAGTYQYVLRYPNRRKLTQTQVPFTVVLKADEATLSDWQLLNIQQQGEKPDWSWEALIDAPS